MDDCPEPESRPEPIGAKHQIHGVLVRVLETGVLLLGESGIGKSECALELLTKGHTFVADDVISIRKLQDRLFGSAPELTRDLLEIRGLGLINVRETFGESVVADECEIDLCVELQQWSDPERLHNIIQDHVVAGRTIPKFVIPVSSGRNIATLVETAVRLYLQRIGGGANAVDSFLEKHARLLDPVG